MTLTTPGNPYRMCWSRIRHAAFKDREQFDSIVTGASDKGTWVRLLHLPIEGKLESGFEGVDVGHRLRVQLVRTNVDRGYIDFKRVV